MEGMMIRLDLKGGILSRMVFGCNEVGVDNTEEYLACFEKLYDAEMQILFCLSF